MDPFPLSVEENETIREYELFNYFNGKKELYINKTAELFHLFKTIYGPLSIADFLVILKIALRTDGNLWQHLAGRNFVVHDKEKYRIAIDQCAKFIINNVWVILSTGEE